MILKEKVLSALKKVIDPDFKKDLVTLNMIKDLEVSNDLISFIIELTTPACPLKDHLEQECRKYIKEEVSNTIEVKIDFSSRVTTLRDKKDVLPGVKNIVIVASGKGGVGKSTVSVNLALGLAKSGAKVGLIDADIYGPSIPTMFGLRGQKPTLKKVEDKHKIIPIEKWGVKVLSIGFLIDESQAVVWRGPMVTSALRQFVTDVLWGELDYLIIDMPPGTGDVHLTILQTMPVTGAVVVTTPQDVALADARKAISMFSMEGLKLPILGIVENMAYFTPPELPGKKYFLFGQGGGKDLAVTLDIPFLGELPIEQTIREGGDEGYPAALKKEEDAAVAFDRLSQNVARNIAILNAGEPLKLEIEV